MLCKLTNMVNSQIFKNEKYFCEFKRKIKITNKLNFNKLGHKRRTKTI